MAALKVKVAFEGEEIEVPSELLDDVSLCGRDVGWTAINGILTTCLIYHHA